MSESKEPVGLSLRTQSRIFGLAANRPRAALISKRVVVTIGAGVERNYSTYQDLAAVPQSGNWTAEKQ